MKLKIITCVLIGFTLLISPAISAQENQADNTGVFLEKVRADKKLFIAVSMKLTESEEGTFWPIYEEYQNELFLLRALTFKLIGDYANAYENMTSENATKLLEEYVAIETLRPKLLLSFLPRFRQVLSDVKVLRYYQLENKINTALLNEFAEKIPVVGNVK